MESQLTIFTIGHSNSSARKFIDLLKQFEIQLIVDVRSSPYSQYSPQFNRESLQHLLKQEGIQYEFAGEYLGGRPMDPCCYKDGKLPDGHADYLKLVDYPQVMTKDFFKTGIERLLQIAENQIIAIMCSEEDPARCHRHHMIGRYLVLQSIEVLHIRADGKMIKDQSLPNLSDDKPVEQPRLF